MRSSLRVLGDVSTLESKRGERDQSHRERVARVRGGASDSAISPAFAGGNTRSALSVTTQDRTLGRSGWRLSASAAERRAHGAVNTRNTAEWVASPTPLAGVTATKRDSLGGERVPRSRRAAVEFETRRDHANYGARR